ncbi:peptidase S8/S53 domain-containing protein [Rhizophagus diaphanus]|nr:peptidase S8/S53 domain-containing protein [Rhizophagus diaphanus] [Rhizophagus sp. MUCL 43196]
MVAPRFAKIFSIAVIVTFLFSSAESAKNETDCPKTLSINAKSDGKGKKFIVVFKDKQAAQRQHELFKNCFQTEIDSFDKINSLSNKDNPTFVSFGIVNLFGLIGEMTPQFAKELEKMDDVDYIEEDGEVRTQYVVPSQLTRRAVDNKPTFNIDRIDQAKRPLNGKYTYPDSAGEGVNVFIVDTGIRITHKEFGGRAKFGGSFCDGCNNKDEFGHGTHVASIACGATLGVARKATPIAVRVLDANGFGNNSGIVAGLNFIGETHSKSESKKSVVNMSLGGPISKVVNDAVKQLTNAGVHVVVAAGNESQDACNVSPASEPSAITVGATEKNSDVVTDFSNFGKCIDIFAPGRDIKGANFEGNNGTVIFSGTSQATPHVAGTIALIIAKDGNKSPAEMATALKTLSTKGVVKGLKSGSPDSFLRTPSA